MDIIKFTGKHFTYKIDNRKLLCLRCSFNSKSIVLHKIKVKSILATVSYMNWWSILVYIVLKFCHFSKTKTEQGHFDKSKFYCQL